MCVVEIVGPPFPFHCISVTCNTPSCLKLCSFFSSYLLVLFRAFALDSVMAPVLFPLVFYYYYYWALPLKSRAVICRRASRVERLLCSLCAEHRLLSGRGRHREAVRQEEVAYECKNLQRPQEIVQRWRETCLLFSTLNDGEEPQVERGALVKVLCLLSKRLLVIVFFFLCGSSMRMDSHAAVSKACIAPPLSPQPP